MRSPLIALLTLLPLTAGAYEKLPVPMAPVETPHGLIFEEMSLAPIRHTDGRSCWTLELNYASNLWQGATSNEAKQRVATDLESDMDAVFGKTRKAVAGLNASGVLPEIGAILIVIDEPGPPPHPAGAFTERAYNIGGGCR